jgi:hypothetical protein
MPTVDPVRTALENFERAEKICRITNRRLDHYYSKPDRLDPTLREWMERASRFVETRLGDVDVFLNRIPELVRLTDGATATRARRLAQPYRKVSHRPVCTSRALPFIRSLYRYYGVKLRQATHVDWNRVIVVPKNWKTGRTIAAEPEGNLPFQLAFDAFVKERLLDVQIDLRSQRRNQQLAQLASIDGKRATVDFSMASDTGAYNAVAWLLPLAWFQLLDKLRAPSGKLDPGLASDYPDFDQVWQYAKFSSMGNGCTFGILTLIFAALAYAVGSKTICVYGDDVVVDSEKFEDFVRLAKFLGFVVNTEKSYSSGPFRESCGTNYFDGVLVTPFFVREWSAEMRKADRCHVVNGLAGISLPEGKLWTLLRRVVEDNSLPLVPYCENTTAGVHVDVYLGRRLGLIKPRQVSENHPLYRIADPEMGRLYVKVCDRRFTVRDVNVEMFKAYVATHQSARVFDARTKALWFLQVTQRELRNVKGAVIPTRPQRWLDPGFRPDEARECTLVPVISLQQGYKRDWVAFQPRLVADHPPHLFWWGEWLTAPKTVQKPNG